MAFYAKYLPAMLFTFAALPVAAQPVAAPRQLAPGVIKVVRNVAFDDELIDPAREFTELLIA